VGSGVGSFDDIGETAIALKEKVPFILHIIPSFSSKVAWNLIMTTSF
jgi:hypothetical protein